MSFGRGGYLRAVHAGRYEDVQRIIPDQGQLVGELQLVARQGEDIDIGTAELQVLHLQFQGDISFEVVHRRTVRGAQLIDGDKRPREKVLPEVKRIIPVVVSGGHGESPADDLFYFFHGDDIASYIIKTVISREQQSGVSCHGDARVVHVFQEKTGHQFHPHVTQRFAAVGAEQVGLGHAGAQGRGQVHAFCNACAREILIVVQGEMVCVRIVAGGGGAAVVSAAAGRRGGVLPVPLVPFLVLAGAHHGLGGAAGTGHAGVAGHHVQQTAADAGGRQHGKVIQVVFQGHSRPRRRGDGQLRKFRGFVGEPAHLAGAVVVEDDLVVGIVGLDEKSIFVTRVQLGVGGANVQLWHGEVFRFDEIIARIGRHNGVHRTAVGRMHLHHDQPVMHIGQTAYRRGPGDQQVLRLCGFHLTAADRISDHRRVLIDDLEEVAASRLVVGEELVRLIVVHPETELIVPLGQGARP